MPVLADLIPSAGTLQCDQDLIFATEIGKLLDVSNINRRTFKALLLPVGLHPIRFHDLPTLFLARGDHPRSFKELLGHSTIGIALDTYSHILLDMQDHVTRALEDALSYRVAARLQQERWDTLASPLLCSVLPAKWRF